MSKTSILDLNLYCFEHILKYLSLKDRINLALSRPEIRQMILPFDHPVYHRDNPLSNKAVYYYMPEAIQSMAILQNKIKRLIIVQKETEDRKFLTRINHKIDLNTALINLNTPENCVFGRFVITCNQCICYLMEFFRLFPGLQELDVSGTLRCNQCFETLSLCFPQLNKFYIYGLVEVSRWDFRKLMITEVRHNMRLTASKE